MLPVKPVVGNMGCVRGVLLGWPVKLLGVYG